MFCNFDISPFDDYPIQCRIMCVTMLPYAFTRNHMYDAFSFVNANLRLTKIHWKNKGAPLGGMGGDGGPA